MYPRNKKRLAIFSYNPKSHRYDTTSHIPERMNGHFSMEDAKEFLAEPKFELAQHYKTFPLWLNKLLQHQPAMIFATLMKLAMVLIGLTLLVLRKTIKDKQTYITVENILIILLLICCFIAMTVLTVSYFWTRAKQKHAFKVMENIQAYIQAKYSYYQRKGVVWSIPQDPIPSSVRYARRDDDDEPKGHNIELWKYDQPNEHHETQQRNYQSSTRLIEEFLFNTDALKFINTYSPLRTDDQVSFKEVKQFLDLATPSFFQYGKSLASLWSACKWGFIGYVLMTIIFCFVLSEKVDGLSLATYSFVYIIIVILTVLRYIKKWQKKYRAIIPNIQAIIEQTAPQINAKGFRWVLPLRHYKSVQLWEDRSPQIESGQLPSQYNTDISETLENKDSEASQGLWPTQIRQEVRADVVQKDIVFFYDNKFLSHHYFSGLTQNKVSKSQIKTLLTEIESRLALYRRTCFSRFFRVFIFSACFVGSVAVVVLLSSAYYPVFAISFTPAGLVVLGLVCTSLFRAHYSRLKKQMFEVIFQRAPEYDQKGLKWFISEGCSLTIVLRDKNAVGKPATPYS